MCIYALGVKGVKEGDTSFDVYLNASIMVVASK